MYTFSLTMKKGKKKLLHIQMDVSPKMLKLVLRMIKKQQQAQEALAKAMAGAIADAQAASKNDGTPDLQVNDLDRSDAVKIWEKMTQFYGNSKDAFGQLIRITRDNNSSTKAPQAHIIQLLLEKGLSFDYLWDNDPANPDHVLAQAKIHYGDEVRSALKRLAASNKMSTKGNELELVTNLMAAGKKFHGIWNPKQ